MTDTALETALFAAASTKQGHRRHAEPDWAEIYRELKRKHVTLTMLWDEYIERCPAQIAGAGQHQKPALAKAGVAVIKACLYEPQVNRTYAEMAAHYDTAILPARPRRPRDKTTASYCTSFGDLPPCGEVVMCLRVGRMGSIK